MATDNFVGRTNLNDPYTAAENVTPHDSTNLTYVTRALWVGTGGTFVVVWPDNTTTEFAAVPNGTLLPIRIKRVNSTGLVTADKMVGLR